MGAAIVAALLLISFCVSATDKKRYITPTPPTHAGSKSQNIPNNPDQNTGYEQRGTYDSPIIVEVKPPYDAQEQEAQRRKNEQERGNREWGLVTGTWALVAATLVLATIAVAQIWVFLRQLRLMRDGIRDAEIAAGAARDGAAAARDGADIAKLTMIARDRAYVHHNGIRLISHNYVTSPDKYFWRLRPMWINSGNTPTRQAHVHIDYWLDYYPLPDDFVFTYADTDIPAMIPPHGIIVSQPRDIDAEDLVSVKDGKKFLYVWGTIIYRDVFPSNPRRITRFCVFAADVTGDPRIGWHAEINPLEISFMTYHRHNCADEECNEEAVGPA